jgi:hypothetical protein
VQQIRGDAANVQFLDLLGDGGTSDAQKTSNGEMTDEGEPAKLRRSGDSLEW